MASKRKRKLGSAPKHRPGSARNPQPPAANKTSATANERPGEAEDEEDEDDDVPYSEHLERKTVPRALDKAKARKRWKLGDTPDDRGPYLIELNVQHIDALPGAKREFRKLFEELGSQLTSEGRPELKTPLPISKTYFRCELSVNEWRILVARDQELARNRADDAKNPDDDFRYRSIYRLWPDFPIHGHINRSTSTVKADAALRSFEATGDGIVWAVVDSGIDATHRHFSSPIAMTLTHPSVANLHRCFAALHDGPEGPDVEQDRLPMPEDAVEAEREMLTETDAAALRAEAERKALTDKHTAAALRDDFGHGSHVAGIIAGRAIHGNAASPKGGDEFDVVVLESEDQVVPLDEQRLADNTMQARRRITKRKQVAASERLRYHGVAPDCRLISLRVLDENGEGRSSDIIRALAYIREKLNDNPRMIRVHGVNLSVGYDFDAELFACGQSPLCDEVNRLVLAGVVVVAAAGNTGYGTVGAAVRATKVGLSNTINDPGNAEHAITVGATHRDSPHTYGVSYFSSKGPTQDGRLKPDLVAPGERITSCATGKKRAKAQAAANGSPQPAEPSADKVAYYIDDSGTSMAAPHVSGAIAAFLSVRQEFRGRPLEVKRIFLESAISLGRERYFEGHGMLDLMKALQSV